MPFLVGLLLIFSNLIKEFLFIKAATIKNALLDKSDGTIILFGLSSFFPRYKLFSYLIHF